MRLCPWSFYGYSGSYTALATIGQRWGQILAACFLIRCNSIHWMFMLDTALILVMSREQALVSLAITWRWSSNACWISVTYLPTGTQYAKCSFLPSFLSPNQEVCVGGLGASPRETHFWETMDWFPTCLKGGKPFNHSFTWFTHSLLIHIQFNMNEFIFIHSFIHATNIMEYQLCVRYHPTASSSSQGHEQEKV